jgi:uncharacterized protein (DUF3084 family)
MKWLIYLACLSFFCACNYNDRKLQLDERENEIREKEKKLVNFQRDLYLKEDELNKRERKLDSVENLRKEEDSISSAQIDTLATQSLSGAWSVEMECTQSTCANSAVGDTQRETWNLAINKNRVLVEAVSSNNVARFYKGSLEQNTINLDEAIPKTGSSGTTILIRLTISDPNYMQGDRELIREDCRVTYSLKMQKQ